MPPDSDVGALTTLVPAGFLGVAWAIGVGGVQVSHSSSTIFLFLISLLRSHHVMYLGDDLFGDRAEVA